MKPDIDMENIMEGKEREEDKWVLDESVDHKGKLPLRASTGVWKASVFVLTIELIERMTYFGIATNLITYLTQVIHQDLEKAAKNVNYWTGTCTLLPLLGGFVADAYTGRYYMVLFSSFLYLLGLGMMTMSQFIPTLKPCSGKTTCKEPRMVHEVVLFLALYCIAAGTGGYKPCLQSFGADQFDEHHTEERIKKMSFFNWWNFFLCIGLLLGATVVVYVEDNVSWGVASLGLTSLMALTVFGFYMGKGLYRYRSPEGNPFKPFLQVLIAAMRKRNLPCPSNPALLYQGDSNKLQSSRIGGFTHTTTSRFRFLDKAAIIEETNVKASPWRLATVRRVEEAKLILNVIPIWLASVTFGISISQVTTLYVKQAAASNLYITHTLKIPPASVASVTAFTTMLFVPIYDKILVPFLRKLTGNERGITILQRMGVGFSLAIVSLAVAALVDIKRQQQTTSRKMSVLWLVPQNLLFGLADAFSLVGLQEYFYDQVPDSMRSLGMALYLSVIGVGMFISSFLITVVNRVTGKNNNGRGWIGKDITSSHLDRWYWLLVCVNTVNLCFYVLLAKRYIYKTVHKRVLMVDEPDHDQCLEDDGIMSSAAKE